MLNWQGYGSLVKANNFFEQRFHIFAWNRASADDRVRANNQAFTGINRFNYIENKHAVQLVLDANPNRATYSQAELDALETDLQAADLTQTGAFPRGSSTVVPVEIEYAQFLWSFALLDGRKPEEDFENLPVTSQAYGGVRQRFDRSVRQDHITHLIPSIEAYHYLLPFFRWDSGFNFVKT